MVRYTDSMCYQRIKAVVKGFYYQQPKKKKKERFGYADLFSWCEFLAFFFFLHYSVVFV